MAPQKTTSQILDAAADLIHHRGLHQGDFVPDWSYGSDTETAAACPLCVLAAINVATGRDADDNVWDEPSPALNAAMALVSYLGFDGSLDVRDSLGDGWNDCDGMTEHDVIAALRGAAEAERATAAQS